MLTGDNTNQKIDFWILLMENPKNLHFFDEK